VSYVVSVWAKDMPAVLVRVVGQIARRNVNIDRVLAEPGEVPGMCRLTECHAAVIWRKPE
jgi:acetolactate synthase small subunit